MKLLRFVVACIIVATSALHAAEAPIYRINYGKNLSKSISIKQEEFNTLLKSSKTLSNLHDENDTTVDIALDITPASMRKFITLLPSISNNDFTLSNYQDNELGEITTLADFLNIKVLYKACINEFAQRLNDISYLKRAINKQSIPSWFATLPVSPDVKLAITQRLDPIDNINVKIISLTNIIKTGGEVLALVYSPDGNSIASGSFDKTIKIWDAKSGALRNTLTGHTGWVSSVAYAPDGNSIASGSSDHTIKIWDAKSGKLLNTLTGHTDSVFSVAYAPDGNSIASGSFDKTIKIWDAKSGKLLDTITGHTGGVDCVAYSPDGNSIASGSRDRTMKIWDAKSGELRKKMLISNQVDCVAYSPDGNSIASGSFDYAMIGDTQSGYLLKHLTGHTRRVYSVAYAPDGNSIASGSEDKTIKIWDAKSGKLLNTLTGHTSAVRSVAYAPDGNSIASGSEDKTIKIWKLYKEDKNDPDRVIAAHLYVNRDQLNLSGSQLNEIKRLIGIGDKSIWERLSEMIK